MAAVECDPLRIIAWLNNRFEYVLPNASLAPAREAIVDRFVWTILWRAILPTTSHLHHMHDPTQNPPIITALGTRLIGWQMRLDFRPLLIGEPKQVRVHGFGLRIG
jgi:hypothetical protein